MKKIVYICLLIGITTVFMTGCESKEEREQMRQAELFKQEQIQKAKDEAKAKEEAAKERARLEALEAENPTIMGKMGFSMHEGKIIIDTNKAKDFFDSLNNKIESTSKEIDKELKEGNLTFTIPAGLEMREEKITIDINKTKSFLDGWGKRMMEFTKEFDNMTKPLHEKTKNQGEER